jgi:hypothetical protein
MNVWSSRNGSFGAGAFAGVGGAPSTDEDNVVTSPATLVVPGGVTIAYRRPIGARRGISAYASPMYRWTRLDDGDVDTEGGFRVSFGVDFSLTQSIGVTAGGELGNGDSATNDGGVFGAAVTFVLGRR